jgi:hypothetical protein
MNRCWMAVAVMACVSQAHGAENAFEEPADPFDWIEKLDHVPLALQTPSRWIAAAYTGTLEFEGYIMDTRSPGLIRPDDPFFNFRNRNKLTLSVGEHLSVFVEERTDRGFDPDDGRVRASFEQYFVRWKPFDEPWLHLQAGKFATPVGNYVPRLETFDNPMIRAPLPYDFLTTVGDGKVVPNVTAQLARRDLPDKTARWVPMIWGPVYHTGVEALGAVDKFDYAVAVTDAALSARPGQWDLDSDTNDKFNYSARLGYSPLIGCQLGVSAAIGPYLKRRGATRRFEHEQQQVYGADASYSIGHWEFWSEFYASRWQVPHVREDLLAYAYYVETRYKFTPGFYGSLRWGQIFFGQISDANGRPTRWDRDAWRVEAGLGYYFARNLVGRIQYEHNHQNGPLQQGANMVSLQLALRLR